MNYYSKLKALSIQTQSTQALGALSLAASLLLLAPTAAMAQSGAAQSGSFGTSFGTGVFSGSEDYLLGSGDRVRLDFFNVPELSGEFQILPNGTINVPQIGAVSVRGRTLTQAQELIGSRAAAILRFPVVTVSLISARPINIAVAGEVNQPGAYSLSTDNTAQATATPTLTRTLRLAEGVTQAADLSRVQIRRPDPLGGGGGQLITVNLWDLLNNGDLRQDVRLRDGDSVFVPAATTIDKDLAWRLIDADFATSPNKPLTISVVGEVDRPGPYTITGDAFRDADGNVVNFRAPTVTRAIQSAGGITQLADVRDITVRRVTRSGPTQEAKVDFWELLTTGDFREDLPLQDGDTVVIARADAINESELTQIADASFSPAEIQVNVAGEVVRPGALTLEPNAPLNEALLRAGGYNERAERDEISLIRLEPNGTITKKEVEIDFAADVGSENNPALRDGDTLVIARSNFSTATGLFDAVIRPFTGGFGLFNAIRNLFFNGNN